MLEELFLILIYCDAVSTESYYDFYIETLNLLIVCFSSQINKTKDPSLLFKGNFFLDIALDRLG